MFKRTTEIVAINLSDRSLEALKLGKEGNKYHLASWSAIALEPGAIEDGRILDATKLKAAVVQLFSQARPQALKPKEVVITLPESKVFSVSLQLSATVKPGEIADILRRKAAEVIPVDDLLLIADYQKRVVTNGSEYFYAATYQSVVEEYMKFFASLGLKLRMVTMESMALAAALSLEQSKDNLLVIDIGARTTIASVINAGLVRETVTLRLAGDTLTQAIKQEQAISWVEAEQQKQSFGVLASPENALTPILLPLLEQWSNELKSFLSYWQKSSGEKVSKIVLVGGSAELPGLVAYTQSTLGLETALGQAAIAFKAENMPMTRLMPVFGLGIMAIDEKLDDINFLLPKVRPPKKMADKVVTSAATVRQVKTVTRKTKRLGILLALLIIAISTFGFVWWRSTAPSTVGQLPDSLTSGYKDLDLQFTASLNTGTSAPINEQAILAAALSSQNLKAEKLLTSDLWQQVETRVQERGAEPTDRLEMYATLTELIGQELWQANLEAVKVRYDEAGQYVIPEVLNQTITTSTPAETEIVLGAEQLFSQEVSYQFLTVKKDEFRQLVDQGWQAKFGEMAPEGYVIRSFVVNSLPDSKYDVQLSIFVREDR